MCITAVHVTKSHVYNLYVKSFPPQKTHCVAPRDDIWYNKVNEFSLKKSSMRWRHPSNRCNAQHNEARGAGEIPSVSSSVETKLMYGSVSKGARKIVMFCEWRIQEGLLGVVYTLSWMAHSMYKKGNKRNKVQVQVWRVYSATAARSRRTRLG